MSEQDEISFYDFREVYRAFFAHVIEEAIPSGFMPNAPQQLEKYLAQKQGDFFLPLLAGTKFAKSFERFRDYAKSSLKTKGHYKYPVFSHLDFTVVEAASRKLIQPIEPGLIGCHYRSLGLDKLRNSFYFGTEDYWEKVKQPNSESKEEERVAHFRDLLGAYFDLFQKPQTFNQQVFNTNHPPGPIGLIFQRQEEVPPNCRNSSTLIVGSIFDHRVGIDLVNHLKTGLVDKDGRLIILSYLTQRSRESSEWENYRRMLLTRRQLLAEQITESIELSAIWQKSAGEFFRKRLPRNDVADDVLGLLTLFQSYLVYGLLAGMCVYTFPTTAQPDLPTCGFTLMTAKPLPNQAIEFVQRVSELVYGELIGSTVLSNYRRFFQTDLLESRAGQKPVRLLGDEKANAVLASALAGSPIPIEAVDTFLSLANKLPQNSIFEQRRYSFFLALVHQEFLERFIDRLPSRRLKPDEMRRRRRTPQELFYNDEVSIELAGHGMRIHAGERNSPNHILFFVYPPYDAEMFDIESSLPRTPELEDRLATAIGRNEAVILSDVDVLPSWDLINSKRLQYAYARYFNGSLGPEVDLDKLAEALTFGNSEVLTLLYEYEPLEKMKIYHGGALILESRLNQWELPTRSADDFIRSLEKCLLVFMKRGDLFDPLIQEFSQGLVKLLVECSRRRKGIFLVFHPGEKPPRWAELDITQKSCGDKVLDFSADGLKEQIARICSLIQRYSSSDGAVVLCKKDSTLLAYTKIHIQLQSVIDDKVHRQALAMKGAQARQKYPALRSFGTKHNAAYEYAMTNDQGGFAITVSSDGPVTLFYRQEITEQEANALGDPELSDWKWRVNIVRMM